MCKRDRGKEVQKGVPTMRVGPPRSSVTRGRATHVLPSLVHAAIVAPDGATARDGPALTSCLARDNRAGIDQALALLRSAAKMACEESTASPQAAMMVPLPSTAMPGRQTESLAWYTTTGADQPLLNDRVLYTTSVSVSYTHLTLPTSDLV